MLPLLLLLFTRPHLLRFENLFSPRLLRPQEDQDCPRVLTTHGNRPLPETAPPRDTKIMPPRLAPTGIMFIWPAGLHHPGPFPVCLLRWGLAPCASCSSSSAPRAFYPMSSPPGLWKFIFCPQGSSTMMGWTSTDSHRLFPPSDCFTLVLCLRGFSTETFFPWPCLQYFLHPWASAILG
jgi:hypothetical protein